MDNQIAVAKYEEPYSRALACRPLFSLFQICSSAYAARFVDEKMRETARPPAEELQANSFFLISSSLLRCFFFSFSKSSFPPICRRAFFFMPVHDTTAGFCRLPSFKLRSLRSLLFLVFPFFPPSLSTAGCGPYPFHRSGSFGTEEGVQFGHCENPFPLFPVFLFHLRLCPPASTASVSFFMISRPTGSIFPPTSIDQDSHPLLLLPTPQSFPFLPVADSLYRWARRRIFTDSGLLISLL